jgi:hypothetical protein
MSASVWGIWADKNSQLAITPKALLYYGRHGNGLVAGFWQRMMNVNDAYGINSFIIALNDNRWAVIYKNDNNPSYTQFGNKQVGFQ